MAKALVLLSINSGSSSVKVRLFEARAVVGEADDDNEVSEPGEIAAAQISSLGTHPAQFSYSQDNKKSSRELPSSVDTHQAAFQYILKAFLNDSELESVSTEDSIDVVCHRVVHGVSCESHIAHSGNDA
jgi:acetate kinase